jgi:glycosyltransferase involved in cell wall biosynthesis
MWPIVVIDGGSTDDTVQIARKLKANVLEHRWTGYADQKNWALDNLPVRSDWVLFLDADEQLTAELRDEILQAVGDETATGFAIPRRYVFLGRPLRHAWWYPDYQLRLFRVGRGRFEERHVHEHVVLDGRLRHLRHALIHENLKGLSAFVERHNRYSDLEAAERLTPSLGRTIGSFTGSRANRRRALKERVWYRLPCRPAIRFLWLYVVKRGFLDGRRGLLFCRLIAHYELLIDAKVLERQLSADERVSCGNFSVTCSHHDS